MIKVRAKVSQDLLEAGRVYVGSIVASGSHEVVLVRSVYVLIYFRPQGEWRVYPITLFEAVES